MIGRRSFLAGIFAAGAAPAIVKAESLMKIIVPRQGLYTGELGVIDAEFIRFVTTSLKDQAIADRMAREVAAVLRGLPILSLEKFGQVRPMPQPKSPLATLRFRRHAGEPIFIPSNTINDLLHGDRKST